MSSNTSRSIIIILTCIVAGLLVHAQNLKTSPKAWLKRQTARPFKPGNSLPLLGQLHCVNPPVELRAEQARNWVGGQPAASLATVENWTEHGLNAPINLQGRAQHDPRITAAEGQCSWQEYVSRRKAYYEGKMRDAVKRRYPNALHTCYACGGFAGKPDEDWAWDYHYLKSATDLPRPECDYSFSTRDSWAV